MAEELHISDDRLSAYLDGELPPPERDMIERALKEQPALRVQLDELQRIHERVAQLPPASVPRDFSDGVMRRIRAQTTRDARPEPPLLSQHSVPSGRPKRRLWKWCLLASAGLAAAVLALLSLPFEHRQIADVASKETRSSPDVDSFRAEKPKISNKQSIQEISPMLRAPIQPAAPAAELDMQRFTEPTHALPEMVEHASESPPAEEAHFEAESPTHNARDERASDAFSAAIVSAAVSNQAELVVEVQQSQRQLVADKLARQQIVLHPAEVGATVSPRQLDTSVAETESRQDIAADNGSLRSIVPLATSPLAQSIRSDDWALNTPDVELVLVDASAVQIQATIDDLKASPQVQVVVNTTSQLADNEAARDTYAGYGGYGYENGRGIPGGYGGAKDDGATPFYHQLPRQRNRLDSADIETQKSSPNVDMPVQLSDRQPLAEGKVGPSIRALFVVRTVPPDHLSESAAGKEGEPAADAAPEQK